MDVFGGCRIPLIAINHRVERVLPLQTSKAREIAIRRAQGETVLYRESREMSVRYEVRLHSITCQQCSKNSSVPFPRKRNPDGLTVQPFFHLFPSARESLRPLEDPRICYQPHEAQQARPRQADSCIPVQPRVEPLPGGPMLRESAHLRIDEKVRIDQDHRNASPSAMASASATSSRFATRQRPSATGRV